MKNINAKLSELAKRISAQDWTPDGNYMLKGRTISYVTGQKLKRVIRPIINDLNLLFSINVNEVVSLPACGVKENHVLAKCVISLTDADSGESKDYSVISEGADSGDKAVLSAVSYAKRMFWIQTFDVIDGLEDEDTSNSQDVVANIRRQAIPESVDLRTSPAKPASDSGSSSGGSSSEPVSSPGQGNIAMMQVRAMDNALAVIKKADEEGKILHDHYVRALEIRKKASCKEDVQAILDIRKELGL